MLFALNAKKIIIQKFIKDFIFVKIVMIIFVEIVVKLITYNSQSINALNHIIMILLKIDSIGQSVPT